MSFYNKAGYRPSVTHEVLGPRVLRYQLWQVQFLSVNYFNFMLVARTVGTSLATVIRLEFAYPGVGILAGDSLQYPSTATAHGAIMVFYTIIRATTNSTD
jgi:heme/copper-type cytochrome/quinol oxidase subunit 1